jgi:hypothetical protein
VDVDRYAVGVLDVVDGDSIARRIEQNPHRLLSPDLVRPEGERCGLVEESWKDHDEVQ